MKKSIARASCSTALLCSLLIPFSVVQATPQPPVGTVIGQVLSTDIQAFVKGKPIPSMNVYGNTAIVVEDLRNYGFDVAWIPQKKQVAIRNTVDKALQPLPAEAATAVSVGTRLGDVFSTDIKASYEGSSIPSYNIGGRTVVLLNDLAQLGVVDWNEKERKIHFTPKDSITSAVPAPLIIRESEGVHLQNIVFGDKTITYEDQAIGKIVNGKPMLSLDWLSQALGYNVEFDNGQSPYIRVSGGGYGFTVFSGQKEAQRDWFGVPVNSLPLFSEPIQSDGQWFVNETNLKTLFGYMSSWNNEKRTLDIDYKTYNIEDYGIPDRLDNYFYRIEALGDISGYGGDIPQLFVTNSINGGPVMHGGSSGGMNSESPSSFKYSFNSAAPADIGNNETDILITTGGRVLYNRHISAELTIRNAKPIVDYTGQGRGDFTRLKSVSPAQAYNETSKNELSISGTADSTIGAALTLVIEKEDNGSYRKLAETTAPLLDNTFQGSVALTEGNGLYRITARSTLTYPRGTSAIDIAKWYVRKTD